ncbi:DUF305 domain-containing protein [Micromonospora sp. CPCC 205371]|nr:DUF305 domain-containing protein [Micromonospora sp. CPCC 205371]
MTRVFTLRRALLSGAALAVLALAAGCGDNNNDDASGDGMNHGAASPTAATSSGAAFNDADVRFAQMMIPHHQQAVDMAASAETRAKDPELKQLAGQIKAAQAPEITAMTGWLTGWGQSTAAPDAGHDAHGMMSDADMTKLESATGAEFDRMFTQMMIEHHEGAIQMARDEQTDGANAEAKALAATIEKTQTEEVATLNAILNRL